MTQVGMVSGAYISCILENIRGLKLWKSVRIGYQVLDWPKYGQRIHSMPLNPLCEYKIGFPFFFYIVSDCYS